MFAFGHVLNTESLLFLLEMETKRAQRYKNYMSLLSLTFGHLDPSLGKKPSISLKTLASLLKSDLRGTDIVGQGGGNRLLFMLPNADTAGAHKVRERSEKVLHEYGFGRKGFGIEIDEVCFPTHAKNVDDILQMTGIAKLEKSETERKWGEEALRQSEERWRSIVQNIPDIILVVTRDGTILAANRTVSGGIVEEAIGKSVYDNVATEHCDTIRKSLERVFQTGKPDTFEILGVGPHGLNIAWYETRVVPNERDGKVTAVALISRDITERKRVEERSRIHQERFRRLVEDLHIIVYRYRFTPISGFEYISPVVKDIIGYTAEELCADPNLGFKLVHPDDRHLLEAVRKEDRPPSIPFSLRWVRKDGAFVWTEQQSVPIYDETGNLVAIEGIARDITERKRTEEKLDQVPAELARSNAELEHLAYVTSHEMDEPLHMVARCLNLLERRYKGKLDSHTEKVIGHALDGVKWMQRLVNDLLAYSRVSSEGKGFAPTNCEAVFACALANLKATVEETGAVVSHDALPIVMADDLQLTQLFQNLIGNAIKFRGEESPSVHVSAKKKENEWLFSVQDNGIGIDPEHFERIFMIFQRLHDEADYPGTGIGLSICKKIVERHGGHIWVDSEPGKGSRFYFTIPVTMIGGINNYEESDHRRG
ncbi:MAG: PAS domain S-box protein [Proteobacteria bacterium]|nr:PAS domain S-box protein [Pseudomonadota bacterium]